MEKLSQTKKPKKKRENQHVSRQVKSGCQGIKEQKRKGEGNKIWERK